MLKLCQLLLFFSIPFLQIEQLSAQQAITIAATTAEHIFKTEEIYYLEDSTHNLTIADIKLPANDVRFIPNKRYYPKNFNRPSTYWFRIRLKLDKRMDSNTIFEFFDQTVDNIEAYIPNGRGGFNKYKTGASKVFADRYFMHKNFEFPIPALEQGEHDVYFKVESRQLVNVIVVYRKISRFIHYTLTEYFTFGLFYGMIILFSFNNLLMYLAVRSRQYIYYVLYILFVGLYEMSTDGIAFQYLWPQSPWFNQYASALFVCSLSVFALLFTKSLLHVKRKAPQLSKFLDYVMIGRIAFFLYCTLFNQTWYIFKFVEIIPLSAAFFTGIWLWKKKYKPARYFVLAYSFLFLGFILKVLYVLGYVRFIPSSLGHYGVTFGFVLEMAFLSFAIRDKVRLLKHKKELAQKKVISQMQINEQLQKVHRRDLEKKVADRTSEVVEKSQVLLEQSNVIAHQNWELKEKNILLEKQAEEIRRMNQLLQKDNKNLQINIEKITDDRAMSKEMNFEEFSSKYQDKDTCYKFLSELKWKKEYRCIKCSYDNYCVGKTPYSRRCTKCTYEESVLYNTLFENVKIPINKALYLVYLVHFYKGEISSYKLSEKLEIRQSTCWNYASKVKNILSERSKKNTKTTKLGWTNLILDVTEKLK